MYRDDRGGGSSSVTMLILAPVMLLFGLGLVQVGMWYHAHQSAIAAAETAAEAQCVLHPVSGSAQAAARRVADQAGLEHTAVIVSDSGTTVTVTVTGRADTFWDLGLSGVSATVTMPKERLS
ncbi:TadE family protein [Acidipropionibacterium acidipropionici]|uniref:TadE-like domain-containing protein n=1 Tax=Acidipropionibacterium acidipropionici TaxID=1748 RepID=A0AAC8YCP3_9ACTN|nr:TadE family protein [Acidipropionibacterium acidipropionici]AMS04110.1 hypothetical protein AXH35_00055 [Acidipropionibacterium acidipropionici]